MSPESVENLKRRRESRGVTRTKGSRAAPYLFLTPFFITFGVFMVYPLLKSLWLTLHQTFGPEYTTYVGLNNFTFMMRDPSFWRALRNTTVFALASLFIQLPLSLAMAILLDSKILKGKEFFRLAFFSPHLVGQVFVGVLFSTLYAPRYGLVNQLLAKTVGVDPDIKWLGQAELVMPALVLTSLWLYVGFNMIYFLAALQTVDKQLYDVKRQRATKPTYIEHIKSEFQVEAQKTKAVEEQIRALQVKRGGMEGDLAAKEGSVRKLQMQLYQVKSNKEYTALLHEIEGVKADNSVLEEEILKMMEQIDQQKIALVESQRLLKEQEGQMQSRVGVVEREIAALDATIDQLQSQRQALLPRVDRKVLVHYERILEKKEGLGLVPVQMPQEACGGCHMNIPPQTINEIRLKERLITCESCARLLYYPDDAA